MQQRKITPLLLVFPIILFGLYPLIPEKIEGLPVIFMIGGSLLYFIFHYREKTFYKKSLIVTELLFFVFFISALLSQNSGEGLKKVETMLSLLAFPIIFYLLLGTTRIDYRVLKNLFVKVFYAANIVFCLFSALYFTAYKNPTYPNNDANFFRNAVEAIPLIGEHPIYISIFVSVAILSGFSLYKLKKGMVTHDLLITFGQVILVTFSIILMSKGVIIALLVSLSAWAVGKTEIKRKYVLIITSVGSLFLVLLIPSDNNRFHQLFKKESYMSLDMNNSTSIRANILQCSFEKAIQRPFFGYGIGDVQQELDKCYTKKELGFPAGKYNSHNEYLFVWLSSGVLGITALLFLLIFYFRMALMRGDYLMQSIVLLYMTVFLFENVLSRQSGVIFFSFLLNFFTICNIDKKSRLNEKS